MVNRMPGGEWESPMDFMPFGPGDFGRGRDRGRGPDRRPRPPQPPFPPGVDLRDIRRCLFQVSDVRLEGGQRFWFYPTSVSRNTVFGFRWRSRQGRWEEFSININRIRSFSCRR